MSNVFDFEKVRKDLLLLKEYGFSHDRAEQIVRSKYGHARMREFRKK